MGVGVWGGGAEGVVILIKCNKNKFRWKPVVETNVNIQSL